MRSAQHVQLGQVGAEPGAARSGGTGDERLGDRAERAEFLLRRGLRPHRTARRVRPRPAVVLIADRGLARCDQHVLSHHLPGAVRDRQQPAVAGAQPDFGADQPGRHGVTRRSEPDARQPVDLAGHELADAGLQRRQRAQQLPLYDQPLGGHRADLAVGDAVDLGAPHPGRGVRDGKVAERCLRHHQVGLGIADQVLGNPFRLGVGGLAEVRLEPVMTGEADVLRRRHDHVGDHAAFQAAHPVSEDLARHPAEGLEALGQQAQCRLRLLVGGEPHEPDPRPRQHRAEHVQPALAAPVDHQMLTRRPHRRTPTPVMILTPQLLLRRDQPPEVPRRPRIPRRPRSRQQPFRRDPALTGLHPLRYQDGHAVIVMRPRLASRALPLASCRAITRRTVLCVVPLITAAPR